MTRLIDGKARAAALRARIAADVEAMKAAHGVTPGLAVVLVGDDLNFGRQRGGNVATLRASGERYGFQVEVIPPVEVNGVAARSSAIRGLVASGDVTAAATLLQLTPGSAE